MKLRIYNLFLYSLILLTAPAFAELTTLDSSAANEVLTNLPEGYSQSILLPVNESEGIFAQLSVPNNFKLILSEQTQPRVEQQQTILEFIPEGEKAEGWSCILTAQSFVGSQIDAEQFVAMVFSGIESAFGKDNVDDPQVISNVYAGYKDVFIKIVYNNQGVKEELRVYVASGPNDTAVIQMTYRPDRLAEGYEESYQSLFTNSVVTLTKEQLPEELKNKLVN